MTRSGRWAVVQGLLVMVPALAMAGEGGTVGRPAPSSTATPAHEPAEDPAFRTVVVSSARPEDAFEVPRSVSSIDATGLAEAGDRNAPEAMADLPGVFVQATNRGGGSPIVRGMVGPQVLLTLDGVRLNNPVYRTGPVQYLNLIDPALLGRIEVLRGPGSVPYGSDAMGGVIALMPLQVPDCRAEGGDCLVGGLRARYASADHGRSFSGNMGGGHRGFSARAGGTLTTFGNVQGGGDLGVQPHSGYRQYAALARATQRVLTGRMCGWRFDANYMFSRIEGAGRTDKVADGSLRFTDNDMHLVWGRMHMMLPRTRGTLTLSYQDFLEEARDHLLARDRTTVTGSSRDIVRDRTLGVDLSFHTRLLHDRLQLQYGGLFYRDWVDAEHGVQDDAARWVERGLALYPKGSGYNNYGVFLMLQGDVLRTSSGHVVRVTGGYRLSGMGAQAAARPGIPAVDHHALGHTGTAGLQYLYRDLATVALTWSEGFRAPNLQETVMYGDSGRYFNIPNTGLGPERSDTLELVGRVAWSRLRFAASGYVSFLTSRIERTFATLDGAPVFRGKDVVTQINRGKGLLWGVEAEAAVLLGAGFTASGNLAYTWGEDWLEGKPDEPLSKIPPLFGTVALRWDTPRWGPFLGFAEFYVRAAGKQDRLSATDKKDSRIPKGGTPGWWTANLRLGGTLWDRLRLGLSFENIGDVKYKYHVSGVYMPGIQAVLTAGLDW